MRTSKTMIDCNAEHLIIYRTTLDALTTSLSILLVGLAAYYMARLIPNSNFQALWTVHYAPWWITPFIVLFFSFAFLFSLKYVVRDIPYLVIDQSGINVIYFTQKSDSISWQHMTIISKLFSKRVMLISKVDHKLIEFKLPSGLQTTNFLSFIEAAKNQIDAGKQLSGQDLYQLLMGFTQGVRN